MRILLDMDGVLCNYDKALDANGARKSNGKSNWELLRNIGSSYWSDMEWLPEGKKLYNKLLKYVESRDDIELGILSAIFLRCGKRGKMEWLKKNCPEISEDNIIICDKGIEKYKYGDNNSILVDDKDENVDLYVAYTGPAVQFFDGNQAFEDIVSLIESYM